MHNTRGVNPISYDKRSWGCDDPAKSSFHEIMKIAKSYLISSAHPGSAGTLPFPITPTHPGSAGTLPFPDFTRPPRQRRDAAFPDLTRPPRQSFYTRHIPRLLRSRLP
ncbi:MAG: hypothetical protein AB7V39_14715, partial [Nitrospiraceae bacterium]